jgi:hypothetical protein
VNKQTENPSSTRWNTVVFGDPLYAPFRIRAKRPDETTPAIERLTAPAPLARRWPTRPRERAARRRHAGAGG